MATLLLDDEGVKPDGSRYELIAWAVPDSDEYPDGVKYSFQYMTADGDTLLRYDNAPHHRDDVGHHHRHTADGRIKPVEYPGLSSLRDRFEREVQQIHDERTD